MFLTGIAQLAAAAALALTLDEPLTYGPGD